MPQKVQTKKKTKSVSFRHRENFQKSVDKMHTIVKYVMILFGPKLYLNKNGASEKKRHPGNFLQG